jgi:hypothetical protein
MRRVFIERGRRFFENYINIKADQNFSLKLLDAKLDNVNIQKSKIVGLLPSEDLELVASQPCYVNIWPQKK